MSARRSITVIGVVSFVVAGAALLTWRSRGVPNLFLEDDAYFYLQIAWNIGTGHGSTFDGINTTNGYHLLWMGILASLARGVWALGLGKTAFLAAACAVSLSLAVTATLVAFRGAAERVLVILMFLFCGVTMESTLLGALLLVGMRGFLGELPASITRAVLVAALVPLTRIDYAWMLPALAVVGATTDGAGRSALPPGPTLAGTVLGAATHFGLERSLFGVWTSVSSAYKASDLAEHGLALLVMNLQSTGNELRYLIVAALAAFALVRGSRPVRFGVGVAVVPLAVYTAVIDLRDWYFVPALVLCALLASRAAGEKRQAWPRLAWAASAITLASFCAYLWLNEGDWRRTSAFVARANGSLRGSDVIFQVDGSGFTGWHLHAHVVNGDGLVNSWSYRTRLVNDRLASYLDEIGATHVIVNGKAQPPLIDHHGMRVTEDDAELLVDAGGTRNPLERYRLLALNARRAVTER